MNQKSLIQETIEARGHKVIFYPKFHCELNFIEMFWGAAKNMHERIVTIHLNPWKNCSLSIEFSSS